MKRNMVSIRHPDGREYPDNWEYPNNMPGLASPWVPGEPLLRSGVRAARLVTANGVVYTPPNGFSDEELELLQKDGWEIVP